MYTDLLKKARARRLNALASLGSHKDNVIPFALAQRREPQKVVVPFVSSRAAAAPLSLAA